MLTIAQKMLEDNNLCVLATCSNNSPNSSLMHYLYDGSTMNIYMLSLRGSVKHNDISANPQVSLLIDTRVSVSQTGLPVMALTVYGKAGFIQDPRRHQTVVDQMVGRYNSLAQMAGDSRCLVIQVQIEKMLLLDGVNDKSLINF